METNRRIGKERIIYDNYSLHEHFDEAAGYVFDELRDNYNWASVDDVPADMVWERIQDDDAANWDIVSYELGEFFKGKTFIIRGTVGLWDGPADAGAIIHSFSELTKAWNHCDLLKIYDVNGHMYIKASHHDGTNHFEVWELTDKGIEFADRNVYAYSDRKLHDKLLRHGSGYIRLPNFANKVYGCKRYEYLPSAA